MPRLFSIVLCDHPAQLNSEKLQLRAIQIRQTGGPEVMRLRETPTRRPGKGEVLIRVEASGVQGRERPRRPPLSGRVLDSTSLGPGPHQRRRQVQEEGSLPSERSGGLHKRSAED
jgi:hypothetical protein